jgi:uncharacterized protein YidB (DUF937 family)
MSLLDTRLDIAKNQLTEKADSAPDNSLLQAVMGFLCDSQTGGLNGLVEKANSLGLTEQVASWIGRGENLSVTGEQIQGILGSSFVQTIAEKTGINTADAAKSLANLVPQVVDKLTPEGQILKDNDLVQLGLTGLTQLLKNK